MDIFNVFTLFGGLAFFLYGMHVMSNGLEKMAGGKLERALKQATSNPFKGLLLSIKYSAFFFPALLNNLGKQFTFFNVLSFLILLIFIPPYL